jgi:hypothetical protein
MWPNRSCRYCQQDFQPSIYRPRQRVCSEPDCQRQRRSDYQRERIRTDAAYAADVRASQKKWRDAHSEYWKQYRQQHPESTERNRQQQQHRDRKRRVLNLAKMNLALDLKREASEVWFVGPAVKDLAKNNLASAKVFVYQPVASAMGWPRDLAKNNALPASNREFYNRGDADDGSNQHDSPASPDREVDRAPDRQAAAHRPPDGGEVSGSAGANTIAAASRQ